MSDSPNRREIRKETRFNYSMLHGGRIRTFDEVEIKFSPYDGQEMISVAQLRILDEIVRKELLSTDDVLCVGEVSLLRSVYRIKREIFSKDFSEIQWKMEWSKNLDKDLSLRIKEYFRAKEVPKDPPVTEEMKEAMEKARLTRARVFREMKEKKEGT